MSLVIVFLSIVIVDCAKAGAHSASLRPQSAADV
jgi:hypothetical protein